MSNPKIFLQPELIEGDNIDIAQDGKTISSNTPLENITNTDITEVEDGQALIYDETSGKWVNGEGGTPIEPNPAAAATDTLSTIKIDNTVFTIGGGGTGDAVLYPLTTAEYNALTPEQKMDENVLYLLTDGGSGGGGGGAGGGFYAPDYENPETITLTPLTWVTYNVTQNGYVMVDLTAFTETGGTSVKVNGTTLNFDKVDGTSYILNSTYMFPVMANDVVEIRLNYDGSGYGSNTALFFPAKGGGGGGSNVIPNPEDEATDVLNSIKIDNATYAIPGGGSFIDVENRIVAPTEFTTSLSYTATEDCVVCMYLVCPGDASTFVKINDFTVQNFWQAELATGPCAPIFVRTGQTLTVTGAHATYASNYIVYGVQSSGGGGGGTEVIPNPQDTPTDTLETISIDGTVYDIESGGSDVSVDPEYDTGTLLATISVDDVDHEIYAPEANNILSGIETPSTVVGEDNNIYIKYDATGSWETISSTSIRPNDTTPVVVDINPNDFSKLRMTGTSGNYTYDTTFNTADILPYDQTSGGTVGVQNLGTYGRVCRTNDGNKLYVYKTINVTFFISYIYGYNINHISNINTVYGKKNNQWFPFPDNEGSEVIANPEDAATDTLTKLSVDGDIYEIPETNVEDVYINGTSVLDINKIAQIKSYQEITKAEYDALPSSKLTDDILYCITDGGATKPGEYYNPVIYSTTEREIGVWIDGKPLYELTLNCGQGPNNSVVNYNLPSNNYDYIMITEGCLYNPTTKSSLPLNLVRTDNSNLSNGCFLAMEQNQIRVNDASDRSAFNVYVTIQYTKTTDTPGSGKYTTLGVPSVHYSADEQVIGTWIDGKTLYQKVLDYNSTVINARVDHDVSSLNIETLVDCKGWAQRITGSSDKYILKDGYILTSGGYTYSFYVRYYATGKQIQTTLTLPSGESTDRQIVIIQYTKTTD